MKSIPIFLFFLILVTCACAQSPFNDSPGDTLGIWSITSFEEPAEYISIGSSSTNIWQIGHPQKAFLNSAYSGDNAIITDTLNPYPASNYSYFDLYLGNFNFNEYWFPWSTYIDFRHKIDSDSLHDGGYITISWDKGQSWENILNNSTTWQYGIASGYEGLYSELDTLFNGEHGFSGRSNGWLHTTIYWHGILVKKGLEFPPDTAILRFNFISDNNDNPREGWMIDDIRLFSIELNGGLDNQSPLQNGISISGNPITESATIHFETPFSSAYGMLYNSNGQEVREMNFSGKQEYILKKDGLNNGLYLLKIFTDGSLRETIKVIIAGD